jgi:magnesium transporter
MELKNRKYEEDVINERVDHLIEHRIPWIILGLVGGLAATIIVSKYESLLSADVRLAFFIPIIVYLSDAIGTQTETIYIRALSNSKKINFTKYILKESFIGFSLGIISGVIFGAVASYWLNSFAIGLTLFFTMIINLSLAPILAIGIPSLLYKRKTDPALGSGPVATILQDLISLIIFFLIASLIVI